MLNRLGRFFPLKSTMAHFFTLNVNGLRDQNKRLLFLQWSHLSADFVCLEETHMSSESECSSWFSSSKFLSLASPGSVHSCGTALLYHPRFTSCIFSSDAYGHFICAELSYHVVSLYAPKRNPDRDTFLQFFSEGVDSGSPTVICRDFSLGCTMLNRGTLFPALIRTMLLVCPIPVPLPRGPGRWKI